MESQNKYKRHIQDSLPRSYHEWRFADEETALRSERDLHQWLALPTANVADLDCKVQKLTPTAPEGRYNVTKKVHSGTWNDKHILHNTLSQWKRAWLISSNWKEATMEQLTNDLSSIHNTCKISALMTIASSAVAGPLDGIDPRKMNLKENEKVMPAFPSEMQNLISDALHNAYSLVRMAAALCQFFIQDFSDEARQIMITYLENDINADSWAAVQCLALDGNHSHLVIQRVLAQLFEEESNETEEQALFLLSLLSERTNLVYSMLGEALNRSNWKNRLLGCRALSCLHGDISWDLKNKLNYLMWNDWSPAVRWESAKSLCKLGQGMDVHNQLRKHLEADSWKLKLEALTLIGWLQIMTASLFPRFLQCFTNDFAAVRRQACQTAGLLQIKDEKVMESLYNIIQNDPVWKIQAQAIRALGQIGYITPHLKELLLWAVRLEQPEIRMEVYNCIAKLRLCDSDIQYTLQDRLTFETHGPANRELKRTLEVLNIELHENQEMISFIKLQMSNLCQKEVLFPKILNLNKDLKAGHQKIGKAVTEDT